MTFTPDDTDVLDWEFDTDSGSKPLRDLTAPDLLELAGEFASTGAAALADTFAVLAENTPEGGTVGDLDEVVFHQLFWGTSEVVL